MKILMKFLVLILLSGSINMLYAQNRLGDIALEAGDKALTETRYRDAVARYTEAELHYQNNNAKIPDIQYKKIIAQDKFYNSGIERDVALKSDLYSNCDAYLKKYQDNAKVSLAKYKEVYNIMLRSTLTTDERLKAEEIKKKEDELAKTVTKEDETKNKSPELKDAEDKNKELKQELSKYKENVVQKIGTFKLVKENVSVYGKENYITKIDSVEVEIKDGFIRNIAVHTVKGVFINYSPISLLQFPYKYNTELYLANPNLDNYILIGEVLDFKAVNGNNFSPDNVNFTLKGIKEKHVLTTNEGLSNYIDYRIYSDFLGLVDEATNGIINFEASACIPVFPSNYKLSNTYFLKAIKPQFRYSRFDNDDRAIVTGDPVGGKFAVINRLDLIQKSFMNAGFAFELFSYDPRKSLFQLTIPVKVNFNLAEVDLNTDKDNITSSSYGSGLELKFSRTNNFGMSMHGYFMELRHHYNESSTLERIKPFTFYNIGAELFFYKKKDNSNSAIFVRFNYVSQTTSSNNFFQLQIGYKSALNI